MNTCDIFVLCEEILRCLEYLHHLMNQYFIIGQFIVLETREKMSIPKTRIFSFQCKIIPSYTHLSVSIAINF